MDDEYMKDYLEMFETNGWTRMIGEAADTADNLTEQLTAGGMPEQQTNNIRGQIFQLRALANLEYMFTAPQAEDGYDATI